MYFQPHFQEPETPEHKPHLSPPQPEKGGEKKNPRFQQNNKLTLPSNQKKQNP